MAMLAIDGPLARLPRARTRAIDARLLDMVVKGL